MRLRKPAAQRGVFAILFAVLLVVILALAGLAIDIGFVYERHGDMKNYANTAAMAAAHQLDGTANGVDNAVDAAEDSVRDNSWGADESADWEESALSFGTSADGPWQDADYVKGLPPDEVRLYRYARVDAGLLDPNMASVIRLFPYGGTPEANLASVVSVAGPVMTQMLPLAVCAMDPLRHKPRAIKGVSGAEELVEHGFRRGVTYNLLRLNPEPGGEPRSYLVNPVDFPDSGGVDAANFTHEAVAPFVCSGSIAQPKAGKLYVQHPFPTSLIPELNSRFGQASTCVASAALPDRNIKSFLPASWLGNGAPTPHAATTIDPGAPMRTVADLDPNAYPSPSKADYGTLWAYVRPVRYHATAANHVGTAFRASDFDDLYPIDSGKFTTGWSDFNVVLPYMSTGGATVEAPAGNSLRFRRILNVPLLACPVTGNIATVLAVGKFMLTAHAHGDPVNPYISAEFGGLLPGSAGSSDTRLYR